jgi:hypothetical protein
MMGNNINKIKKDFEQIQLEVDYVFCLPGATFSANFLYCWSETIQYLITNKKTFVFINFYSPLVTYTRNQMLRGIPGNLGLLTTNTKLFNNEIKTKKIIFIDDDIYWTIEDLKKILESDKDIISGFYKMLGVNEKEKSNYITGLIGEEWLTEKDIKNTTGLIELDAIGFGFVAIKSEVFEKIKFPWFETYEKVRERDGVVLNYGEDFNFCQKALKAGFKVYGDPTVKVGHEKKVVLNFDLTN